MDNVKSMIMIVDDNIANLKIGKNALAEQYVVLTVPSAEKMFGRLLRNKSALIFLDIDMPDVDGYEAIKILKNSSETRDIPVIFLTGKNASDSEPEGLRACLPSFRLVDLVCRKAGGVLRAKNALTSAQNPCISVY